MSKLKVLYIDDDVAMMRLVSEMLSRMGLQVRMASRTAEADAVLSQEKVDIIVSDVQMEGEDGLTYCRRIRAEGNRLPVILLSAGIDPNAAHSTGANLCMNKPFDVMKLHQQILALATPLNPSANPTAENR